MLYGQMFVDAGGVSPLYCDECWGHYTNKVMRYTKDNTFLKIIGVCYLITPRKK